jgi:hypothetical protein
MRMALSGLLYGYKIQNIISFIENFSKNRKEFNKQMKNGIKLHGM